MLTEFTSIGGLKTLNQFPFPGLRPNALFKYGIDVDNGNIKVYTYHYSVFLKLKRVSSLTKLKLILTKKYTQQLRKQTNSFVIKSALKLYHLSVYK